MPLVSIIIPVYNTEKYLRKCLDSVVYQTYKNIEIIVVDDYSSDCSREILKEYEQTYNFIKVIHNPINMGLATTRNIGLEQANGDYILFVDSDDYVDVNLVKEMFLYILIYQVDLIEFNYMNVFSSIPLKKNCHKIIALETFQDNPSLLYDKDGRCCNKCYHHKLLQDLRFPDGVIFEDNAFTYPAFLKANTILKTDSVYYYYRRNLSSITIQTKFFPSEKILSVFDANAKMKENCVKNQVYSNYREYIDDILACLSLIPALSATTWFNMKQEDRKRIVQLLYYYANSCFSKEILNTTSIKRKMENNKLYRARIQYLLSFLNSDIGYVANPLSEVSQMIRKYVK